MPKSPRKRGKKPKGPHAVALLALGAGVQLSEAQKKRTQMLLEPNRTSATASLAKSRGSVKGAQPTGGFIDHAVVPATDEKSPAPIPPADETGTHDGGNDGVENRTARRNYGEEAATDSLVEDGIDTHDETVDELHAKTTEACDDDRARKKYEAQVLLKNARHIELFQAIATWCEDKNAYLKTMEPIMSVAEAQKHLSVLSAFSRDKQTMYRHEVGKLKRLGGEIKAARYKHISTWQFETPQEIDDRESKVEAHFLRLDEKLAARQEILEEDLAREEIKAQESRSSITQPPRRARPIAVVSGERVGAKRGTQTLAQKALKYFGYEKGK